LARPLHNKGKERMNKKLSRRDFLKLAGITSAGLALSACGVNATKLPTATFLPPTSTPLPTATITPTLTSTPIPLEQLPETKQELAKFIQAFQSAGVNIAPDQLIQNGLEIRTINSKDGNRHDVALAHVENSQLEGDYPLMIKNGVGKWEATTLGNLGELKDIVIGGMVEKYPNTEKIYQTLNGGEIVGNWGFRQEKIGGGINLDYEDFQLKYTGQFPFGEYKEHMLYDSLIWSAHMPEGFDTLTRDQAISEMGNYVETVMTKYKDKIGGYVVVNEPRTNDLLMRIIGNDYIEIAFRKAREVAQKVNPGAILIYNQTDNHDPNGKFIKDTEVTGNSLWTKGLIDAIGVQGHLAYGSSTNYPSEEDMYKTLVKYKAPIILTELDVNLNALKIGESEKNTIGAEWYKNLVKACLRTGRCKAIYVYGAFPDKNSWYVRVEGQSNADSTLWSNDSQPKKAYYEFMKALVETP
jgi:hypothetical protein